MNDNVPASVLSTQFFNKIAAGQQKEAADAATDYTRLTLREEGLARKILPPQSITEADLDVQLDTDKPVKIVEKEVSQPLSVTVPFGTLPTNTYMNMDKYRVDFARIVTENYVKDIQEVKTWKADIRNIFKDNAIKDMMTAEDVPFFNMIDKCVSSTADPANMVGNQPSALTGKVQYYDFSGAGTNPLGVTGFSRDTCVEALKVLSKGYGNASIATPIRLLPELIVMNVNTGLEYMKFTRDEAGGDLSEKMFKEGLTETTLLGKKHIFTLKDDIVPDGVAYYFAAPQFLGRSYLLEDSTMFLEQRAYMLEFFLYECIGQSIGNPYACSRVKFF